MRKSVKLVVMVSVIAILAGVYWVITVQNRRQETPEETEETLFDVFSVDKTTLTELAWTNEGNEYVLRLRDDAGGWLWEENQDLPLNNGTMTSFVTALTDLTSPVRYEVADSSERSEKYGLSSDGNCVTICDTTHGRQTLYLGKINSYNGKMYVTTSASPDTVYMIDPAVREYTALTPEDMIVEDTLPEVEADRFRGVKLQQGDRTWSLFCTVSEADGERTETWNFFGDGDTVGITPDADQCAAVLAEVVALRYGEAVTFRRSEWNDYGVGEDPVAKLTIYYTFTNTTTNTESGEQQTIDLETSYTLYLGHLAEDGRVYTRLPDHNGIYLLSLSALLSLTEG